MLGGWVNLILHIVSVNILLASLAISTMLTSKAHIVTTDAPYLFVVHVLSGYVAQTSVTTLQIHVKHGISTATSSAPSSPEARNVIDSTPTTSLPPAATTTGATTNPCEFLDRSTLVSTIQHNLTAYNISLLVKECPNICDLVYGGGNPDISGIGVMISYIVQFCATALFGPFLVAALMFDHFTQHHFKPLIEALKEISHSVHAASVFLSMAISIASIIRLEQDPPVFEIEFVRHLVYLQLLLVFAIGYAQVKFFGINWRLGSLLLVTEIVTTGVLAIVAFAQGVNHDDPVVVRLLTDQCIDQYGYPRIDSFFSGHTALANALEYFGIVLVTMIVLRLILSARKRIPQEWINKMKQNPLHFSFPKYFKPHHILKRVDTTLWNLERHWPGKYVLIICTILWILCCIYFIYFLQHQRAELHGALMIHDELSEWGFAQVSAVLAWLPVVQDILVQSYELWLKRGKDDLVYEGDEGEQGHENHELDETDEESVPLGT